jgi:hypothetical protein
MNEHGGVDVCDVHDAGHGDIWNGRASASICGESGAFGAFWADAVDDIGVSEIIVLARGASRLRVRGGQYGRACEAKGKLVSARDVRLTWGGVIRGGGVIVRRDGHHIC